MRGVWRYTGLAFLASPCPAHTINHENVQGDEDIRIGEGAFIHSPESPAFGDFPSRRSLDAVTPRGIQVSPLYGSVNDYAYYFVDVLVGTPPKRQSVILDSGSSLLGFPCVSCGKHCGRHLDDAFDPSLSSTAERYGCDDKRCTTRLGCSSSGPDTCRYSQIYSEGSSIEGYFFSDFIAFAPLTSAATEPKLIQYDYIGCHTRETVLFPSQKASGILGVSFPRGGRQPTVMDVLLGSPHVNSKVFSLCVSEEGGTLTVGGYNSSYHVASRSRPAALLDGGRSEGYSGGWFGHFLRGSPRNNEVAAFYGEPSKEIVWSKIISDVTYAISLKAISSNGRAIVTGGFGECVVDSGTTYTYLPNDVYVKVSQELLSACNANNLKPESENAGQCIKGKSDLVCYHFVGDLPVSSYLKRIPSFQVHLGNGGVLHWGPESYLFRKTDRVWCSAIENNRRMQTILGMSFVKMKEVIFDRDNSYIGFVSADCPSHFVSERTSVGPSSIFAKNQFLGGKAPVAGGQMKTLGPDERAKTADLWNITDRNKLPYLESMRDRDIYGGLLKDKRKMTWSVAGSCGLTVVLALIAAVGRSVHRARTRTYNPLDDMGEKFLGLATHSTSCGNDGNHHWGT